MPNWNPTSIALATTFHCVAIFTAVFRLLYRFYTADLWWEDTWAFVALLADIVCLVLTWLEQPVSGSSPRLASTSNWILSFAFPAVIWASRISILVSMVRVSQPEGKLKSMAVGIGLTFGVLWLGLIGQRIKVCIDDKCIITRAVIIAQTVVDGIADVLLTWLSIAFLRDFKLSRKGKLLMSATLSASMLINVATIVQAVVLLSQVITSGMIIVSHVKYALSLIACNLLVIVTWVHRITNGDEASLDDSQLDTSKAEFSTVELPLSWISPGASVGILRSDSSSTTKSSTWSFRGPDRSGSSSIVTGASGTSDV